MVTKAPYREMERNSILSAEKMSRDERSTNAAALVDQIPNVPL